MRAATTPSRRERASPPPVRPKIEQVFTPANTHRHRTPHPGYHAAHTAMATGQHQATGSAQEHRATTTRAAAPASKTLTPPHPRPAATPTKETSGKVPPFAPLGDPQHRDPIRQPPGLHRPVLQHRARGELDPTTPCARRGQSCCTVRETSLVLRHCARDELEPAHRARDERWTAAGGRPILRRR